jgi:hypothetical protein
MPPSPVFKCLCCNEKHRSDYRNRGRQRYCPKPACRRASKAATQRRWLERPENENYFLGADNCERVRQWRQAHPGYWRNKKPDPPSTLQAPCGAQPVEQETVEPSALQVALQDICYPQPALFVGLISMIAGSALQEDIAATARAYLNRGEDILRTVRGSPTTNPPSPTHENQTHSLPAASAARASPV